jgi:rubrerythrin
MEDRLEERAQAKLAKLERLYHVGQNNIWDGREVLQGLIAQHGPPCLPPEKKDAALRLLSVLLWGELAAWAISADLAEQIDDVEAKMAATSQAHDEARHFYVLRDYLRAVGEPVPHLGGIARNLLLRIMETPSLVKKLIGMQLLVESNALGIFHGLADAKLEPVLTDLLPYYERDEARHVGLGVMYLPRLLKQLTPREARSVALFQLGCVGSLMSGGLLLRADFAALGMKQRELSLRTIKLQDEILRDMVKNEEAGRRGARGLLNPAKGMGPRVIDFLHPPGGVEKAGPLHQAVLRAWTAGAGVVDRALA